MGPCICLGARDGVSSGENPGEKGEPLGDGGCECEGIFLTRALYGVCIGAPYDAAVELPAGAGVLGSSWGCCPSACSRPSSKGTKGPGGLESLFSALSKASLSIRLIALSGFDTASPVFWNNLRASSLKFREEVDADIANGCADSSPACGEGGGCGSV